MLVSMEIAFLILIGLLAGGLSGLFGIGGGILIVPALVGLFDFSQKRAQGTSLVALIAPVGIFALYNYWKEGQADLRAGAWIACSFFFSAWLSSRYVLSLPDALVRKSFAVLLVSVAAYLWFRK